MADSPRERSWETDNTSPPIVPKNPPRGGRPGGPWADYVPSEGRRLSVGEAFSNTLKFFKGAGQFIATGFEYIAPGSESAAFETVTDQSTKKPVLVATEQGQRSIKAMNAALKNVEPVGSFYDQEIWKPWTRIESAALLSAGDTFKNLQEGNFYNPVDVWQRAYDAADRDNLGGISPGQAALYAGQQFAGVVGLNPVFGVTTITRYLPQVDPYDPAQRELYKSNPALKAITGSFDFANAFVDPSIGLGKVAKAVRLATLDTRISAARGIFVSEKEAADFAARSAEQAGAMTARVKAARSVANIDVNIAALSADLRRIQSELDGLTGDPASLFDPQLRTLFDDLTEQKRILEDARPKLLDELDAAQKNFDTVRANPVPEAATGPAEFVDQVFDYNMTPSELMNHRTIKRFGINSGKIASIIDAARNTGDRLAVMDVLQAAYGDVNAYARLNDSYAAVHEMLRRAQGDLSEISALKNSVEKNGGDASAWLSDNADALTRLDAELKSLVQLDKFLAEAVSGESGLTALGALDRGFSKFRGVEQLRAARARSASQLQLGAKVGDVVSGWSATRYQMNALARPVVTLQWVAGKFGKEVPSGNVMLHGMMEEDGILEMRAWAQSVDEWTPDVRENYVNAFIRAGQQVHTRGVSVGDVRKQIIEMAERNAFLKVAEKINPRWVTETGEKTADGFKETLADIVYQDWKKTRNSKWDGLKQRRDKSGHAYMIADDGTLVTSPVWDSQLDYMIPIMDVREIRKAFTEIAAANRMDSTLSWAEAVVKHRHELKLMGQPIGSIALSDVGTAANFLYQAFDRIWRPAVLLRAGYTQRNVAEGWLRTGAYFLNNMSILAPIAGENLRKMSMNAVSRVTGEANATREWVEFARGAENMPNSKPLLSVPRSQWIDTVEFHANAQAQQLEHMRLWDETGRSYFRERAADDIVDAEQRISKLSTTILLPELTQRQQKILNKSKNTYGLDSAKTIHIAARRETDEASVAEDLDLNSITLKDIEAVSSYITAVSQKALERDGFPEQFSVWRSGDLYSGVVSVTTQAGGLGWKSKSASEYVVNRSDVLTYGEGFLGKFQQFAEKELHVASENLIPVEQFTKAPKIVVDTNVRDESLAIAQKDLENAKERLAQADDDTNWYTPAMIAELEKRYQRTNDILNKLLDVKARKKRYLGDEMITVGPHEIPDAYLDASGSVLRDAVSSEGRIGFDLNLSNAAEVDWSKIMADSYKVYNPPRVNTGRSVAEVTGNAQYWPALEMYLRQLGQDTLAEKILAPLRSGATDVDQALLDGADAARKWLKSAQGKTYLDNVRGSREYAEEFSVDELVGLRVRQLVESVGADEGLLTRLANREMLLAGELRSKLRLSEKTVPIHGQDIEALRAAAGRPSGLKVGVAIYDAAVKTLFRWLGSIPEDLLVRHPFAVGAYRRNMQEQLRRFDESGAEMTQELMDLYVRNARTAALKETRNTLYTIVRKKKAGQMAVAVSPFIQAQQNSLSAWARLLYESPAAFGYGQQAWMALDNLGQVDVDPQTGETYLTVQIPDAVISGAGKLSPAMGEALKTYNKWSFAKAGFNLIMPGLRGDDVITQSIQTLGISPIVQIPVGEWIKRNPDIDEQLAAIGIPFPARKILSKFIPDDQLPRESTILGAIGTQLLPAWMRNVVAAADGQDSYRYSQTVLTLAQNKIMRQNLGLDPKKSLEKIYSESEHEATMFMFVRATANLSLPIVPRYETALKPYVRELRALQDKLGPQDGFKAFVKAHPDMWYANASLTSNPSGVDSTTQSVFLAKKHSKLMDSVTGLDQKYASLVTDTVIAGEFDTASNLWKRGSGFVKRKNALEALKDAEVAAGWVQFHEVQEKYQSVMAQLGVKSLQEIPWLAAQKKVEINELGKTRPEWFRQYEETNTTTWRRNVEAVRMVAFNPDIVKDEKNYAHMAYVRQYFKMRDWVEGELRTMSRNNWIEKYGYEPSEQELSANFVTIENRQAAGLKVAVDYYVGQLKANELFARTYDRWLDSDKFSPVAERIE